MYCFKLLRVQKTVNMRTVALATLVFLISVCFADDDNEERVYWKQWNGEIPGDAIIGGQGTNDCGEVGPIYLVALYDEAKKNPEKPGCLYHNSTTAKYTDEYYPIYTETRKYTWILCAKDPSEVVWLPIEKNKPKPETIPESCVIGGNLSKLKYFGRTKYENEDSIGRIDNTVNKLHFPYYEEVKTVEDFEILCYKQNNEV